MLINTVSYGDQIKGKCVIILQSVTVPVMLVTLVSVSVVVEVTVGPFTVIVTGPGNQSIRSAIGLVNVHNSLGVIVVVI